jgi:hypothetical protein
MVCLPKNSQDRRVAAINRRMRGIKTEFQGDLDRPVASAYVVRWHVEQRKEANVRRGMQNGSVTLYLYVFTSAPYAYKRADGL